MKTRSKWMVSFLVVAFISTTLSPGHLFRVQAKTVGALKIAPDLAQLIQTSPVGSHQKLIVQFNETPRLQIDALLLGLGGTVTRQLNRLGIRIVELPVQAVAALAARDEVQYISLDHPLNALGHIESTTGTAAVRDQTTTSLLGLITATTVYDGRGIGIAILDSGIDVQHAAFRDQLGLSRVVVSRDFTGENRTDDVYGHGTHVASIAAGNSEISDGAYTGIAPAARLLNLRILNSQGTGFASNLLAALDWIMTYRAVYDIRVVNMSVGTPAIDSYRNDPLCQAVRRMTDAGIIVIAAAGNNGKGTEGEKIYGRIHSPGNEPAAITVGASNSFGTDVRGDDTVTSYSSRGPTRSFWIDDYGLRHYDNLLKPDLVAPGNKIIGAAAVDNSLLANHPELDANVSTVRARRMMYLSGSSMAAPIAAGTAALMIQANPKLTPGLVKAILMYTAQSLVGANTLEQGAGQINVEGAIRLAQAVRTDLSPYTPLGAPLLNGPTPAQETFVTGQTFAWSRGIILAHCYATSDDLIAKYQKIYGQGFVLSDGIVETSTTQSVDPSRMAGAIALGSSVLTSNGTSLGKGTTFLDLSFLLGDGVMLSDGIMIGDGVMVGDGIVTGDGILVGDITSSGVTGDDTACMQ
jgi:serine protease AprX